MPERTTEQILLDIEKKMDSRFDNLEQRVSELEKHVRYHDRNIDTFTDILERLTRDDDAVVGRAGGKVRIDRDAVYRAFDREGISHRRALRALADQGRIQVEYEPPRTRRFTPKVRIGPAVTRCVVAIIREVSDY